MASVENIAVFGRADVSEDSPEYRDARLMGRLLAGAGFTVVNGGYGGVMEAVSRGAAEVGGRVVGVVSSVFGERAPNRYLTSTIESANLFERTARLIDNSDAFLALSPRTGTTWEVLSLMTLRKAGVLGAHPLVLVGPPWEDLIKLLRGLAVVDDYLLEWPTCVRTPIEALDALGPGSRAGKEANAD